MEPIEIEKKLKKKVNKIRETNWYQYFPKMLDDLDYIWNGLVEDLETLSKSQLIEHNYEINRLVVEYVMEVIKIYIREQYHMEIQYEFEEVFAFGGCAAYDRKTGIIKISVLGMMIQAINTTSYLQPPLHEFRHHLQHQAYQKENIEDLAKFPPYFILLAKHHAFMQWNSDLEDSFYLDNYNRLYPEVDAETDSVEKLRKILPFLYQKYKRKTKSKDEYINIKVRTLQQQIEEDEEEIREELRKKERLEETYQKEITTSEGITSFFIIESTEVDSLIAVDQYIKSHPELQDVMPIFALIFQGERTKTYDEIIMDKKRALLEAGKKGISKKQIIGIYSSLIKSDPILYIQDLIAKGKIAEIEEFLKQHPTIRENYKEEVESIRKNASEEVQNLLEIPKQYRKEPETKKSII